MVFSSEEVGVRTEDELEHVLLCHVILNYLAVFKCSQDTINPIRNSIITRIFTTPLDRGLNTIEWNDSPATWECKRNTREGEDSRVELIPERKCCGIQI